MNYKQLLNGSSRTAFFILCTLMALGIVSTNGELVFAPFVLVVIFTTWIVTCLVFYSTAEYRHNLDKRTPVIEEKSS